ncbi:MAG: class II SORL domain-containing protein [Patescibacteria group bacterium]|jgi:superoxide reductase
MEIKQPKDLNYLNDFEKKHIPFVELPKKIKAGKEFKLKVKIGEIVHPMMPEHYIMWVAVYNGDILIAKNKLEPNTPPETEFTLKFDQDTDLRFLEECNIHGIWENKIKIVLTK